MSTTHDTASSALAATPGQTVGPFFGYALPFPLDSQLVPTGHPDAVRLHGQVLDGDGAPLPDAILELSQAGPDGEPVREPGSLRRDGWTFTGWGRASTDNAGHYTFTTLAPTTPFVSLTVFARGLLDRLFTRVYIPEHADDPFVTGLGERGASLVAVRDDGEDGAMRSLRFDVHLQGDHETVFLTYPRHQG